MPPMITDDDMTDISDDADTLPPKKPAPKKAAQKSKANSKPPKQEQEELPDVPNGDGAQEKDDDDDDDGDDDDDDEEEDEYVVEKIMGHDFDKSGVAIYKVKWLGYEDEKDMTWEPKDSFDGARDMLEAYWKTIGGDPEVKTKTPKTKAKGGKRKSMPAESTPDVPKRGGKRAKTTATSQEPEPLESKLPEGSWEDHIQVIESLEQGENSGLVVLVSWNTGKQTSHNMQTIRQKCPQKLIDYYESKLVFKHGGAENEE